MGSHTGSDTRAIPNRAGYISVENGESRYYVFPQIFKTEICRGIDHKLGLEALAGKNLLIADTGRNTLFGLHHFFIEVVQPVQNGAGETQ